jgi:hypothetical protein
MVQSMDSNRSPLNSRKGFDEKAVTNPPGILVTQCLNGVNADETVETSRTDIDGQASCIYGTSVFAEYQNGKKISVSKHTDDKIVIGYCSNGLPFQIVVDGFFNGDTKSTFGFIDQYVTPLMDDYAEKLSESDDPEKTIRDLVTIIDKRWQEYSRPSSQFTMSIAITYEKNDQLYCAGFGIGDTGIVLQKADGSTQQLAYTTEVCSFKDGIDSAASRGVDAIINRNSIFNVAVAPGDEIFSYTYLMKDLLIQEKQFFDHYQISKRNKIHEIKDPVIQYKIADNKLAGEGSLFEKVKKANQQLFQERCQEAQSGKKSDKNGDDCTMGTCTVPAKTLQNQLKKRVYDQERTRLAFLSKSHANRNVRGKAQQVLTSADKLKKTDNNRQRITRHLAKANAALKDPSDENIQSLMHRSRHTTAQATVSPCEKALGIAMMGLGIGLAIFGGLIVAGSLCALPTGFLTLPAAAGVAIGSKVAATGIGLFAVGLSFFAPPRTRTLLHNMLDLAGAVTKNKPGQ